MALENMIAGVVSILFGIEVLMFPGLLRFIVGAYFILLGIVALLL